jgi:hypothetical protein
MSESGEPRKHFADEEWAFLRYARFGELPPRVPPTDLVEAVESDLRRDIPEPVEGQIEQG